MNPLRLLATALTFLTRLPLVARFAYGEAKYLARSAWCWPIIGAGLGWMAGGIYHLALQHWSPGIAALLAVASVIVVTGAFHEDGLADSADGFFGGYTPERRLEIMKDSRIGTFGGLALILHFGLSVSALATLRSSDVLATLIWAHALARLSSLPLAYALPYARGAGANKPVAEGLTLIVVFGGLTSIVTLAALLIWLYPQLHTKLLCSAVLAIPFWLGAGWYCKRKIGGITGDALGAINQLTLLLCFLIFSAE